METTLVFRSWVSTRPLTSGIAAMFPYYLLSVFFALSHTLSLHHPSILQLPSLQNTNQTAVTPWPPVPFRFILFTSSIPLYMTIREYGSAGPPNDQAYKLLEQLQDQMSAGGGPYDRIRNQTESALGITSRFTEADGSSGGITRAQAESVFRRLWGWTIFHGAVSIQESEIEFAGRVVERFELDYGFE